MSSDQGSGTESVKAVCYTLEVALEKAIAMEERGFRNYLKAIQLVKDRQGKAILRDAAKEELDHKQRIELALLEGHDSNAAILHQELPTMNLDYVFEQKEISPDADARTALAYAIHLEKQAVDFYKALISGCEGAPMAGLFKRLLADETRHLKNLEDFYERYFLTEN
ncbi:ferritin family protein [Pelobacter seleniigenes]|uniref:ferritin family protein n=1 Tax=Pelobacter seleniigenes TaxID=407188 RepID=UPI0004A73F3A|nr:ferritin family protein [Pelobacter seleniigenes]